MSKIKVILVSLLCIVLMSCETLGGMVPSLSDNVESPVAVGAGVGKIGIASESQYTDSNVKNFNDTTRTVSETNLAKVVGQQNTKVNQKQTSIKNISTPDLLVIIFGMILAPLLAGIIFGLLIPTRTQRKTYKIMLERLLNGK